MLKESKTITTALEKAVSQGDLGAVAELGRLHQALGASVTPQDEDHDAIAEVAQRSSARSGWAPGFIDYFYVSVTNSSAFSPTDTMPLSPRAKLLMAIESVSALCMSVLVVSFGVGLLQH